MGRAEIPHSRLFAPPTTSVLFTTASDDSLIALIQGARTRLALIAPALTTPVADALAARMADLPALSLTVILDADAEV